VSGCAELLCFGLHTLTVRDWRENTGGRVYIQHVYRDLKVHVCVPQRNPVYHSLLSEVMCHAKAITAGNYQGQIQTMNGLIIQFIIQRDNTIVLTID